MGEGSKKPSWLNRTTVLFVGGLVGTGYVTVAYQTDRPTLLILFASMMGLPLFLNSDARRKNGAEK